MHVLLKAVGYRNAYVCIMYKDCLHTYGSSVYVLSFSYLACSLLVYIAMCLHDSTPLQLSCILTVCLLQYM